MHEPDERPAGPPPAPSGATVLTSTGDRGGGAGLGALRQRLDFEELLARTAAAFVHRPSREVSHAIGETLADIARFAGADRAFLYLLDEGRLAAHLRQEWTAPGVDRARSRDGVLAVGELGRWLHALEHDRAVYVPRVADLGPDWAAERARLEGYGCRSVLAVPLADEGRITGFVGFDLVRSERLWSDDNVTVLASAAGVIAQALARDDAERRFRLAFDHAPLGMALHRSTGEHLQVNAAYCRLVGRSEADLLGGVVAAELIHPDDVAALRAARAELVTGGRDHVGLQARIVRPDGTVVWGAVHLAAVRDGPQRALRYTVTHVEEITERVRRDAELQASERRYRTLVENLPSVVLRYDRDLRPVLTSAAARHDAPAGVPASSWTPLGMGGPDGAARWQRVVRTVLETGERTETELETVADDGQARWYQVRAVPEHDGSGAVAHVLVVCSDITDLKRSEAQLVHQALHDPLTGLANRALLVDFLDRSLTRRDRDGIGPAVLFIDLDRFKWVNDSLGHRAGDDLLVAVARRLRAVVRPADLIARLGGDEFVVVLDPVVDPREPARVAERLRRELSAPIEVRGVEVTTTGSIGIALPNSGAADADGLLRDADAAMYLAKANGRDRFEIFDAVLRSQARAKLGMESALRRAIHGGGLEVHYQPELDLDSGEVVGFEALVRWNHPTEGRLTAGAFIDLAEETGLIVDLGEWVLREACRQAGRWTEPAAPRLRVNLSRRQLTQADLVERVGEALAAGGIDGSRLCLEITETALMADPVHGMAVLEDLRDLGVELAIDDFGTGYSSLAHLKRFPVHVLKIDRSFVDGLGEDPDDTAIATAIISLARSMGLRVVAEGVETRRQLDELRRLGCDGAQGFLFARPSPPDEAWPAAPWDLATPP